ncbi:MAG: redox-sensing transcriptional repressor Rex [Spirochaetales bacterium]|jgi:redox-sensing transcriptional repressor|nr:redox-sensing transcriptional repressor Rex [Spirochaetales bacterium]
MKKEKILAVPSIRRLPMYLNVISYLQAKGETYISAPRIARELDMEAIQIRKDLSITGIAGQPKKGYRAAALLNAIERFLGWDTPQDAALVGVGNLGSALLGHEEFVLHGLHIAAAFDTNSRKIGSTVHGIKIMNAGNMDTSVRGLGIKVAILTLPPEQAQEAADMLVKAGVEGIWNFTTKKLEVPHNVVVQNEDLSSGFAMLCVGRHIKKVGGSI